MTKIEMQEALKARLSPKLYEHSIAVRDMMMELAETYNADNEKAYTAGLLHDCAKELSYEDLIKYAMQYNIDIDSIQKLRPGLLHAPVGAVMAKSQFGVEDKDVLHAIKVHNIGCKSMSKLDKLLYLADSAESNRSYAEVHAIRDMAFGGNLNGALLKAMEVKIIYVINKGYVLHPTSVEARNEILIESKRNPKIFDHK